MNNTNGFIFLIFTTILLLSLTGSAFGHFDDCITMNRVSNGSIICVSYDTLQKLIDREYAYVEYDWQRICDNNTNSTNSCQMIRNTDTLCIFVVSDPDTCIDEREKPLDHDQCFKEYEFYVRHPIPVLITHNGNYSVYDEYQFFSVSYCDLELVLKHKPQDRDGKMYQFTHHKTFVENYGVSDSIHYGIYSIDESNPPWYHGYGDFLSPNGEQHHFTFTSNGRYLTMNLED